MWLSFVCCACQTKAPERSLLSVTPSVIGNDHDTAVTLHGKGFMPAPAIALGSPGKIQLNSEYRVRLSDVFHTDEVERVSDEELRVTIPAGLTAGSYDVRLEPPLGAAMVLRDALTVKEGSLEVDAGVFVRRLSLETQSNGEGEPLAGRTLKVGESLDVYAVFREPDGAIASDPEEVELSVLPVLGELAAVDALHSVFSARLPGELSLRAVSSSGLRAEAALSITPVAQHGLADYSLSLEDAPGGAGTAYRSERAFVAGTLLDCYAVVRDLSGAFVLDVPVDWSVSGAETSARSSATSLSLPLVHAGVAQLRIVHATLGEAKLALRISPARAASLSIEPETASPRAGDAALSFTTKGRDEFSNVTQDLGDLTYSLVEGDLGTFDAVSGTLTPEHVGAGRIAVQSSYGASSTSGLITVNAGPLVRLDISPGTLQLTADAAPVQFEVSGVDAFDNQADIGETTWSVATGPIGTLSADGVLDPNITGEGRIRATSSFGVGVTGGPVVITGGRATSLSLTPATWHGLIGGAPQTFAASGVDADGNATTDVGAISFSVTGPLRGIDAQSGLFTPTVPGQGSVTATSSYGPTVTSQSLLVSNPSATLTIQSLRVSDLLFWGATTRVEVDVRSNDVADIVLTGFGFSVAASGGADITSQYSVVADNANLDHIAAGATQTLVYYLSVLNTGPYEGNLYVTARGEAFNSAGRALAPTSTVTSSVQNPAFGTGLTIDLPVPPNEHACAGGRIGFRATASSPFNYAWRFPEGTYAPGDSYNDRSPSLDFDTVGTKTYSVTVSYTFLLVTYPTMLVGKPVYIGTSTNVLADTYPTGRVVFSSPVAEQNVPLSSFPRSSLITIDPALPLRQCNNVAVDATGHTAITLFSDRKLIDPAADLDPAAPGIQMRLTAQGFLPSVPLLAPSSMNEGATTLYAEYFEPKSGTVTAAGDVTFNLSADTQPPSVSWSLPASDCGSACLKTREPLIFQFSEPVASSSNVKVDLYAASSCTGAFSDWSNSSTLRYDAAERALYVVTPSRAGTYSVRVRLPATVTDAAAAKNPLAATSRCVVFSTLSDPAAAATPQLIAAASGAFSPDGDQSAESVSWNVSADAATSFLRLRISRNNQAVFGHLLPVTQAGNYSLTWNGTDAAGRVVNNGAYSYAIEAVNRAGVASTALRGFVEVQSAVGMVSLRRRQ
ncbi:MAG TPA: FlgD immunoglobulin-like domain containing protein [Polyangiales bacterium]|nr:FlgD immunoglobulin-like domain containing protein [Polyangiales bacterium]